MTYLAAFLVAMVYVGLRATQQRHVQHAEYARMPLVSLLMGYCDVFLVASVVSLFDKDVVTLFYLATAMGLGSGLGSMLGTYLHARKH